MPTRTRVDDAVRGILPAVEGYDNPEAVNLGTSHEVSTRDIVVDTIARLTGFRGEIESDASYPDEQPRRKVDVDRVRCEFGLSSEVALEHALRRTVEWFEASQRDG